MVNLILLRNPFIIIRKFTDLKKYKNKFDDVIERIVRNFNELFKSIEEDHIKSTFWKLVDEEIEYNPFDWSHIFSTLIVNVYKKNILLEEGKIAEQVYEVLKSWLKYLGDRFRSFILKVPDSFLQELYTESPVANLDLYISLLQEGESLIKEYDLYKILQDDSIDPILKIRKFKEAYMNYYEIFLTRCEHMGNFLSEKEGNPNYGHNLTKIFNLYKNKKFTYPMPPENVRETLILLKHFRNSCAHSGFKHYEKSNDVKISDRKWNITIEVPDLWAYFHLLLSMDKELNNLALTIHTMRQIGNLTLRYNRTFICPDYKHMNTYLMLPTREFIICRNCKNLYFTKKIKTIMKLYKDFLTF